MRSSRPSRSPCRCRRSAPRAAAIRTASTGAVTRATARSRSTSTTRTTSPSCRASSTSSPRTRRPQTRSSPESRTSNNGCPSGIPTTQLVGDLRHDHAGVVGASRRVGALRLRPERVDGGGAARARPFVFAHVYEPVAEIVSHHICSRVWWSTSTRPKAATSCAHLRERPEYHRPGATCARYLEASYVVGKLEGADYLKLHVSFNLTSPTDPDIAGSLGDRPPHVQVAAAARRGRRHGACRPRRVLRR